MKLNLKKQKIRLKKYKNITGSDIILLIMIIVLIISYIMLKVFTIKSEKILLNYAENKSKELSQLLVNNALEEIIIDANVEDIINLEKNQNNEIISLDFNNVKINEIELKISKNIQKNLKKLEENKKNSLTEKYYDDKIDIIYEVPMSIIYDVPILVGIGPKVPFKLDVLGNVKTNVITNIKEYGINNSLVEVILNMKINIQIILPFSSKNIIIESNVPLKTKVIQGKIPTYYGGIISNKTTWYM